MASERWRTVRKWARRRRRALLTGGVVVLAAVAAYLIHDTATEPVVGEQSDASDPFIAPSATPILPPSGTDLRSLDPANAALLPTGGQSAGCPASNFTMTYSSDVPIAIGGYLTSAGGPDYTYGPTESTGSVAVQQCPTNPSVLIIVQAGPDATTLTCTAAVNGRTVETKTVSEPYGVVYCFA